jgi:hypothetical protein
MKKSHKKYYFINGKVQQEELKNTSDGSLWILGYGYNAVWNGKKCANLKVLKIRQI